MNPENRNLPATRQGTDLYTTRPQEATTLHQIQAAIDIQCEQSKRRSFTSTSSGNQISLGVTLGLSAMQQQQQQQQQRRASDDKICLRLATQIQNDILARSIADFQRFPSLDHGFPTGFSQPLACFEPSQAMPSLPARKRTKISLDFMDGRKPTPQIGKSQQKILPAPPRKTHRFPLPPLRSRGGSNHVTPADLSSYRVMWDMITKKLRNASYTTVSEREIHARDAFGKALECNRNHFVYKP
jgi:hypothetical protein